MKIIIGVPCMEEVKARFAQSLAALWHFGEMEFFFCIGNGCAESRDIISHYAIDNNADYVFFIDSDETFEPDVLSRLLQHDKDIISGLVMHRKPPYHPVLLNLIQGQWVNQTVYPKNLFKVGCSGGGACLLIKVSTLRKVLETTGELWTPFPRTTEDLSFAQRCIASGVDWWCDPSIHIGHIGTVEITPEVWERNQKNEKT